MAISSLGVGSSILTQDVLDQLREADEAGQITPIEYSIADNEDKQDSLSLISATMTNFTDSTNAVAAATLWDERSATVTSGTSVEVAAAANTDIQDFTLNVTTLATKQIEESGAFSADTNLIATAAGTMNINVNGLDYTIDYDDTTTLDDLKDAINDTAGVSIDATIVQITTGEYRLFLSSVETGTSQDITITDDSGFLSDDGGTTAGGTLLTATTAIQTGVDAAFTFNGQAITRESNEVSDLITGLTITLKETGSSEVSIAQDRTSILEQFDSFVENYNAAITQLESMTLASTESEARGIFSSDSTIKSMLRSIEDIIGSVGGGVGTMYDYGFDVDEDGVMTLDSSTLEEAMDDNLTNVQAFFSGGDYTDPTDLTVTTLDGAFVDIATVLEAYTDSSGLLDNLDDGLTDNISILEDRLESATERLDAKYEIMKKQWAAYDLMINQFTSASSMFVQMANAQTAASS